MLEGTDSPLMRKIARGDYVVDEYAVAEAILRRGIDLDLTRSSSVLVSTEVLDDLSSPPHELDAG